jgi:mRNA interferase RelE/StbE
LPKLVVKRQARDQLADLPIPLQRAVENAIDQLRLDPESIGYPLMGRLRGLWSLKVGNYRVIYSVEGSSSKVVVIRAIRHRAAAYRRRR